LVPLIFPPDHGVEELRAIDCLPIPGANPMKLLNKLSMVDKTRKHVRHGNLLQKNGPVLNIRSQCDHISETWRVASSLLTYLTKLVARVQCINQMKDWRSHCKGQAQATADS
jgi:hypothetical protein